MFSTTTMPSSTSIPNPSTRANSTTMFRVIPIICNTIRPIPMEKGMAVEMKNELRNPRKNVRMPITRNRPVMMWLVSSATISRISMDWSKE